MPVSMKLILLGDQGVGKSSLLVRFLKNVFKDNAIPCTVLDMFSKNMQVRGIDVLVTILDTAGQEQHKSITRSYYHHADGVLLVYDASEPTSFHKLHSWLNEIRDKNDTAEVLIVGNKVDVHDKQHVSLARNFCGKESLEFAEASAKSGENVDLVFNQLIEKVLCAKGYLKLNEPEENAAASEEKRTSDGESSLVENACECAGTIILSRAPPVLVKKKSCC